MKSGPRPLILEKRQRPHLYALAGWGVGGGGRIVEGGVRREAGAPVGGRIIALDEHHLVPSHVRKIEPVVIRVVGDVVGLAGAIRIDQIGLDQIAGA